MKTSIEIQVRPTEIDVLGHVNNCKYLEYLEWGREEWYEQIGFSFQDIMERGSGTVTVNININYRKEARLGEKLRIDTQPSKRGNKSFTLYQAIYNENGEKIADAEVTCVVIDLKKRKSVPLPDTLATWFSS